MIIPGPHSKTIIPPGIFTSHVHDIWEVTFDQIHRISNVFEKLFEERCIWCTICNIPGCNSGLRQSLIPWAEIQNGERLTNFELFLLHLAYSAMFTSVVKYRWTWMFYENIFLLYILHFIEKMYRVKCIDWKSNECWKKCYNWCPFYYFTLHLES